MVGRPACFGEQRERERSSVACSRAEEQRGRQLKKYFITVSFLAFSRVFPQLERFDIQRGMKFQLS